MYVTMNIAVGLENMFTVEVLLSGHHWNAKKVFITGAGHFKEWKIQSLYGSWVNWGFVKVAISRASTEFQVLKINFAWTEWRILVCDLLSLELR